MCMFHVLLIQAHIQTKNAQQNQICKENMRHLYQVILQRVQHFKPSIFPDCLAFPYLEALFQKV